MTEAVIVKSDSVQTDDDDGLTRIIDHLNDDSRFDYMRKDGGGLVVHSFIGDVLEIAMTGNCGGCSPVSIAGTRWHVHDSLTKDFAEVKIAFVNLPPEVARFLTPRL